MSKDHYKYPRLYIESDLNDALLPFTLNKNQAHYLVNVMRKKSGDVIRLFNGRDGEYLCHIEGVNKKSATVRIDEKISTQPAQKRNVHLLFSPLKKNRMDFVIEKCTELGVTDFHPILTERTEVRTIKRERIEAQIIEACEQSERLNIPRLHDMQPLPQKITQWNDSTPIMAGIERHDAPLLWEAEITGDAAFLIGPVGGLTQSERDMLINSKTAQPISLGPNILRAETASMVCISAAFFSS